MLTLEPFDTLLEVQESSFACHAIFKLLQCGLFLRRWILQKALLARDAMVYYGSESMPWQDLADTISLFFESGNFDSRRLRSYETISYPGALIIISTSQSLFHISSDGTKTPLHSLENLAYGFQIFQSSEPRDTI